MFQAPAMRTGFVLLITSLLALLSSPAFARDDEACLASVNFRTGELRPLHADYPTIGAFVGRLRTADIVTDVAVNAGNGQALTLRIEIGDALTGETNQLALELRPTTEPVTGCSSAQGYAVTGAAFDGERLEHPALIYPLLSGLIDRR